MPIPNMIDNVNIMPIYSHYMRFIWHNIPNMIDNVNIMPIYSHYMRFIWHKF